MIYHGVSLVSHGTIISNRDANREPCLCAVRRRVVAAAPDARSSFSISNKRCFRTSLQKSWSLVPGNGILPAETNVPEWPLRQTLHLKETKSPARNAAISGHSATNGEISVRARLYGGAERTRTSNQAAMSRHRGLGGLELPTKRLSALALDIEQRARL